MKFESEQSPLADLTKCEKQLEEAKRLILRLFFQDCWSKEIEKYDHLYIGAYEDAQEWLINMGLIKQEDCVYNL